MIRRCEICNKRDAKYVCQECGRQICELCFNPSLWVCLDCTDKIQRNVTRIDKTTVIPVGMDNLMKITIIGFIVIVIGMMLIMIATLLGGRISGGIIIFPFIPIPLIFGFGPEATTTIIIATILMIILIILAYFTTRKLYITEY